MPVLLYWGEREEVDRSTSSGSFSAERSAFSRTLIMKGVTLAQDLVDTIVHIVGTTATVVGDGGLNRILPKADPQFPWMVVEGITGLQGVGTSQEITVLPAAVLEAPLIDDSYGLWSDYDCNVAFSQRPYPVLDDDEVDILEGSWFEEGDALERPILYATEWVRFCVMDRRSKDDWVTATQGDFMFETGGGPPDGQRSKGQIRQYLNNADVVITHYGVPLRWVRSSNCYYEKFRGRVNQNTWNTPWYDWLPGELLYQNFSYREYTPVVAKIEADDWFPGIDALDKLCDVTLSFLETKRYTDDTPPADDNNFVVGGHNLQPWHGDRLFHYGRSGIGTARVPSFYSFPVEILFTDPDFPQPVPAALEVRRKRPPPAPRPKVSRGRDLSKFQGA